MEGDLSEVRWSMMEHGGMQRLFDPVLASAVAQRTAARLWSPYDHSSSRPHASNRHQWHILHAFNAFDEFKRSTRTTSRTCLPQTASRTRSRNRGPPAHPIRVGLLNRRGHGPSTMRFATVPESPIHKNSSKAASFDAEGLWSVAQDRSARHALIPGAPLSISPGHALR